MIIDTKEQAEIGKNLSGQYLKKAGLEYSEIKIKILKTYQGFDFLGYTFKTINCSWHHATITQLRVRKIIMGCSDHLGTIYIYHPTKKAAKEHKIKSRHT